MVLGKEDLSRQLLATVLNQRRSINDHHPTAVLPRTIRAMSEVIMDVPRNSAESNGLEEFLPKVPYIMVHKYPHTSSVRIHYRAFESIANHRHTRLRPMSLIRFANQRRLPHSLQAIGYGEFSL